MYTEKYSPNTTINSSSFNLENGSRVAIIGGGPSGSFFGYFLLDMAERADINISDDIYEEKDFSKYGPAGCNHCGGIISESLVQMLSTEGIIIPNKVLQRGIDSYVLHMETGTVKILSPTDEKRIAAVYRGAGPLGTKDKLWDGFDQFLLELAEKKGVHIKYDHVENIDFKNGMPVITTKNGESQTYELVAGSTGLKNKSLNLFEELYIGYKKPQKTKTHISEY